MNWSNEEETEAKQEYLSMVGALKGSGEFDNEWVGQWEDFHTVVFGRKDTKVKGDRIKYMNYWVENQKVLNDNDWDKIKKEEEDEHF